MAINNGEESNNNTSYKSLFNALSMAKKYGRDALICATVFTGMSLSAGGGAEMIGVGPAINLAALSLVAAVFTTLGRYAGGAVGYALDRIYDSHKENPPLSTSFGRKSLACVGGFGGTALLMALMYSAMMLGLKSAENNTVVPDTRQMLASTTAAQLSAPMVKI